MTAISRGLAVATLLTLSFVSVACGDRTSSTDRSVSSEELTGTVFEAGFSAPDFALSDQTGSTFHMSTTRGKVVVLTFIYTHCTDTCPFIAVKVKNAHDALGDAAKKVSFVAVTTDPARDTREVLAEYSRELGLYDVWHFVTGEQQKVAEVWDAYHIASSKSDIEDASNSQSQGTVDTADDAAAVAPSAADGLSGDARALAGRLATTFGGGYDVAHSSPIWIIDQSGDIRVSLTPDASPQDIVSDVRALLDANE